MQNRYGRAVHGLPNNASGVSGSAYATTQAINVELLPDNVAAEEQNVDKAISQYVLTSRAPPPAGCCMDAIKLFVGNLPKHLSDKQIYGIFNQIGPIVRVSVSCYGNTRKSKGSAFIWYARRTDARRAILSFHGKVQLPRRDSSLGRPLTVRPADHPIFASPGGAHPQYPVAAPRATNGSSEAGRDSDLQEREQALAMLNRVHDLLQQQAQSPPQPSQVSAEASQAPMNLNQLLAQLGHQLSQLQLQRQAPHQAPDVPYSAPHGSAHHQVSVMLQDMRNGRATDRGPHPGALTSSSLSTYSNLMDPGREQAAHGTPNAGSSGHLASRPHDQNGADTLRNLVAVLDSNPQAVSAPQPAAYGTAHHDRTQAEIRHNHGLQLTQQLLSGNATRPLVHAGAAVGAPQSRNLDGRQPGVYGAAPNLEAPRRDHGRIFNGSLGSSVTSEQVWSTAGVRSETASSAFNGLRWPSSGGPSSSMATPGLQDPHWADLQQQVPCGSDGSQRLVPESSWGSAAMSHCPGSAFKDVQWAEMSQWAEPGRRPPAALLGYQDLPWSDGQRSVQADGFAPESSLHVSSASVTAQGGTGSNSTPGRSACSSRSTTRSTPSQRSLSQQQPADMEPSDAVCGRGQSVLEQGNVPFHDVRRASRFPDGDPLCLARRNGMR